MVGFAVTQARVKFRSQLKHNSYLKARRKVGLLASHFCGCLACTRKSLVKILRLFGARCKWAQFPPTWFGKGRLAPVCPLAGKALALQYSRFKRGDKEPAPPAPDHHAGGTPRLGLTAPGRAPELGKPLRWYRPQSPEPPVEQDSRRRRVSTPATQHHPVPGDQLPGDQQQSISIFIA